MTGPLPPNMDAMFVQLEGQFTTRHCLCPRHHHHGHAATECPHPAAVVVKLHMSHNCIAARKHRPDLIDENGDGVQILCADCYQHLREWVVHNIAQTEVIIDGLIASGEAPELSPEDVRHFYTTCECGRNTADINQTVRVIEEIE